MVERGVRVPTDADPAEARARAESNVLVNGRAQHDDTPQPSPPLMFENTHQGVGAPLGRETDLRENVGLRRAYSRLCR